jgi:hypothetical protein
MKIKAKSYTSKNVKHYPKKIIRRTLQKQFRQDMRRVIREAANGADYIEVDGGLLSYVFD